MAEDTLLLKTNKEPTFWNKEAAIGFFVFSVIGLVIGGFIGKSRMEREKAIGKPVSKNPSIWNKDMALGLLIGGAIAGVAAAALSAALLPAAMTVEVGALALGIGVQLAAWTGMIIGGYIGGKKGQEKEQEEYLLAQQQQMQQGHALVPQIRHGQAHGMGFAQRLEQERALAAAQAHTR